MKLNKKNLIDLLPTVSIECNKEEVKEGARIKFLTLNKLLTRHPVLLAQIINTNNSQKLKS